jgi:hypothetical protein
MHRQLERYALRESTVGRAPVASRPTDQVAGIDVDEVITAVIAAAPIGEVQVAAVARRTIAIGQRQPRRIPRQETPLTQGAHGFAGIAASLQLDRMKGSRRDCWPAARRDCALAA